MQPEQKHERSGVDRAGAGAGPRASTGTGAGAKTCYYQVYEGEEGLVKQVVKEWLTAVTPGWGPDVMRHLGVLAGVHHQPVHRLCTKHQAAPRHKVDPWWLVQVHLVERTVPESGMSGWPGMVRLPEKSSRPWLGGGTSRLAELHSWPGVFLHVKGDCTLCTALCSMKWIYYQKAVLSGAWRSQVLCSPVRLDREMEQRPQVVAAWTKMYTIRCAGCVQQVFSASTLPWSAGVCGSHRQQTAAPCLQVRTPGEGGRDQVNMPSPAALPSCLLGWPGRAGPPAAARTGPCCS